MSEASHPIAVGRLLTIAEVTRETGLSRATIYRRIRSGDFPACARLGPRTVRWSETEVEAWKRARFTDQPNREGARLGASQFLRPAFSA